MKSKPLLVGITGGIGSGKTTISKVFQTLGVPVYNSDARAKSLLNEDEKLKSAVVERFGRDAYDANGMLNRQFLAKTVFADEKKLESLNALVHPAVGHNFSLWTQAHTSHSYLIKEAALLFETGSYRSLDYTILVKAPEEVRILRILKRDPQRSRQQIADIINKQLGDSEKEKLANFILTNDDKELLIPQILKIDETIRGEAKKRALREV